MNTKTISRLLIVFTLFFLPKVCFAEQLIPTTVVKVLDIATIEVNIDGNIERVRLIGIDMPPIRQTKMLPYEKDALQFAKEKLENKVVYLETDISNYDKYRRMLAYVWLEKPSSNINLELKSKMFNSLILLNGYAKASTTPPNMKYVQTFLQYQNEAKRKYLGIWAYPD